MPTEYMFIVYILSAVLGLCVGSFLNVVIYRLPKQMSLAKPASHCPNCDFTLKWYHNIPVLSYVFLRGGCASCKVHIPFRYTAVELFNMVLWLACVFLFWEQSIVYAVVCALCCSIFICITFIDLEHFIIFDRFNIMLLVLAVTSMFFDPNFDYISHLIGGGAMMLFFIPLFYISMKIYGKEVFGGGDVKLIIVSGFFLGWEKMLVAVLIFSVVGSIVLMILKRAQNAGRHKEYPFAPFISVGVLTSMLVGTQIVNFYISLF